jgi:hypothetical protein
MNKNILLLITALLFSSTGYAANTPCSGGKGGIASCVNGQLN